MMLPSCLPKVICPRNQIVSLSFLFFEDHCSVVNGKSKKSGENLAFDRSITSFGKLYG
ncbi:hypothetical protein RESH_03030 [Rhodopirellula europaea SH398]|uniref:Uncharacterized protein n=1 Tax=Rhodopirellula europaea SH398 TaxID=1263868 RepID=M5SFC7_9BACT|nr:hypothetical protein RESH_03030 [Rhodopirellula europaea SH398]